MTSLTVWRRTMWLATILLVVASVVGPSVACAGPCGLWPTFPLRLPSPSPPLRGGSALPAPRPLWPLPSPRAGAYGIGVLSRVPFTVVDDVPAEAFFLAVRIVEPPVTIVGAHAFPPFTPHMLRLRDREFARIAAFVRGHAGPLVLLGDLNS